MADDILDRLKRVNEFLERTLRKPLKNPRPSKTILTKEEVKSWLEKEPCFGKPIVKPLSDDSYHPKRSDEDLTEPLRRSYQSLRVLGIGFARNHPAT